MHIFFRALRKNPSQLFILPLLFLLLLAPISAQTKESRIPSELQQWIPWVLYEQEEVLCTLRAQSTTSRYCSWPSNLILEVDNNGGTFRQQWLVETRSLVPLPGNSPLWPTKVTVDNKEILMAKIKNRPAVWLDPGAHTIRGEFSWSTLPEYIYIPPATGLIQLTILGERIRDMQLDTKGKLWFKSQKMAPEKSEESLGIQVFRKIADEVPLRQELEILLTVSGTPRQIHLGLKGDPAFAPLQIRSPLPVRLDMNGRLTLQVRPGQWRIRMSLRNTLPSSPKSMTIGAIDGPWPSQEFWAFAANPKLRQVDITGVPAIDPTRTDLPREWQHFPVYLIKSGESMRLNQKSRGNSSPVPNRLTLQRKIWLDEDGGGLTVKDELTGIMTRGWRLNTHPSQLLGRVAVNARPQLITSLKGSSESGVEVRQGKLNLTAESRIQIPVQNGQLQLPALGWNHKVQKLNTELHLPPGWSLLAATGVDKISTWITRWTLLDIFLVLIIALATSRILGTGWGVVALLFLTLSLHQPGSPKYLWLVLLALLAIQKLITAGSGKQICKVSIVLVLGILTISAIPFVVKEVRVAIYPQLEFGNGQSIIRPVYRDTRHKNDTVAEEDKAVAPMLSSSPTLSRGALKQASNYSLVPAKNKVIQIDPKDMIQTGPGLPAWQWKKIFLSWNGPVDPDQKFNLYLLSPLHNSIAGLLRVLLLLLFLGGFFRYFLRHPSLKTSPPQSPKATGRPKTAIATKVATTLTLLFSLFTLLGPLNSPAAAEVPPPEILKELQQRLLAPPKCGKECVTINSCTISIDNNTLQVKLNLDALIRVAVPLPGKSRFFDQIILDGKAADILRLDPKQYPLIRVEQGRHTILLKKELGGVNTLSFSFPLRPETGQAQLDNWSISGLYDNGRLDKQLSLKRIAPAASDGKGRERNSIEIPAFVRVERSLHMGLQWTVTTRIVRLSPKTAIALDIPLLPGEQVTTAGLQIREKQLRINMGPEQQSFSFRSSMEPVSKLRFKAAMTTSWTEVWFLDVSPIWHVTTEGLPEINQTNPAGKRYPEYHPYPGETLDINISRPAGVPGPSMTVTSTKRVIKPGLRATETSLFLSLNASRGLQHTITLPPGVELQKSLIDGKELSLQLEGNKLKLPLLSGKQDIEIDWRSPQGIAGNFSTETIDIGVPSVNNSIEMKIPSSRWIILTGGPRIGPAVLFWGELLVILLIAILLGRVKLTPLGSIQWLLLSIGLSQVPIPVAAVVVAWLLLLGLRKKRGHEIKSATSFNFLQVALGCLTLLAMAALLYAIQQGLLGHPDMQIGGNGSNGHLLRWYQDRTDAQLPNAWLISVPLLAYRIAMLIWSLWLAMALLNWIRWGWQCFSEITVWKTRPPRPKKQRAIKQRQVVPKKAVRRPAKPAQAAKTVARKRTVPTGNVAGRSMSPQPKKEVKPAPE